MVMNNKNGFQTSDNFTEYELVCLYKYWPTSVNKKNTMGFPSTHHSEQEEYVKVHALVRVILGYRVNAEVI